MKDADKLRMLDKINRRQDKFNWLGDHGTYSMIFGILFLFIEMKTSLALSGISIALSLIGLAGSLWNIRALNRL